jgi:protein required for attachment to host cells
VPIWILVSDASRATLYGTEKQGDDWQVIGSYSHPESRRKNSELSPTEPGHSAKSKGQGSRRTALEPDSMPIEAEMEHFAQELADLLAAGTKQKSFDTVALVAPPHFLGLLRHRLSSETEKRLVTVVHKDYTFADAHEARRRLEDAIFAQPSH